jgi:hypothetical protein
VIEKPENTNSVEIGKKPNRHRIWILSLFSIAMVLFALWLIPYFFANRFFRTALLRSFAEITKETYVLDFEDLRINIFSKEITFYSLEMKPLQNSDTTEKFQIRLKSDTLLLRNPNIFAFRNQQIISLRELFTQNIKIEIINRQEDDSLSWTQKFKAPLNNSIRQFQITNFRIEKGNILLIEYNDSIQLPNFNLSISDLRIDSAASEVKSNRFHYSNLEVSLKNQEFVLPDKSHTFSWENLFLSTKEMIFGIDGLCIQPNSDTLNDFNLTAISPQIRFEGFETDSLFLNAAFRANLLKLHFDSIQFVTKHKNSNDSLKEQLNFLLSNYLKSIDIESGLLTIESAKINFAGHHQVSFNEASELLLEQFHFATKENSEYSLKSGYFIVNRVVLNYTADRQRNFKLSKGFIDFESKELLLNEFEFISDSNRELFLSIDQISLSKVIWNDFFHANSLTGEELVMKGGNFEQQHAQESKLKLIDRIQADTLLSNTFRAIQIEKIKFEDWNYLLASKAIKMEHLNAEFNQFRLPGNADLHFWIFDDFNTNINELSWVSADQRQHYLLNEIETNSIEQSIKANKFQSFPRWKTLNNNPIADESHIKLWGEKLLIITQKPFDEFLANDTLFLRHFSIDSVNLKQYGKIKSSNSKTHSIIPPVFISSFELGSGDFSAYKDQTVMNRLAQLNGIRLKGDSLVINSTNQLSIHYKHLFAVTSNGFYQNEAQGLNFNFKRINYDSKKETMDFNQLNAEFKTTSASQEIQHKMSSKSVQMKGFDPNLYFECDQFYADEFTFNSPQIISKAKTVEKNKGSNLKDIFSKENLSTLPFIEINKLVVNDLSWTVSLGEKENISLISFAKGNLKAEDFRLSYQSFINPERVFFSKAIDLKVTDFKQHLKNGNFLLMIDTLGFSSLKKEVNIEKIQFYTLQKKGENNVSLTIQSVDFQAINFDALQNQNKLQIGNISIQKPSSRITLYGLNDNSTLKNLNTLHLFPLLEPYLTSIEMERMAIQEMNIFIETPKTTNTNTYNLAHLDLQIEQFKLDSTTKAFQNNQFFYAENASIQLHDYTAQIADGLYTLDFENMNLSTKSGTLNIDSLRFRPHYNYADFANRAKYQTDRFDIAVNSIKFSGIDFQDALFRQKYKVQKAEIDQLRGEDFRDGTFPRKPDYFPKNLVERLLALPYFIEFDSVLVRNSFFEYKEQGAHFDTPGSISFSDLNADISNISTNPDFIQFGGNTFVKANTMLMGKSRLNLEASFPLMDSGKLFKLNAHLDRIEMDDLESITKPLALIQAESGTINSIDLKVYANDDYAMGEMLMIYNNMKVAMLNKSLKKGILGSYFANAIIIRENPSYLIPRKGPIYFERRKDRSMFNYWAEISILGMKTSLGLADRKTAKKVKRLRKNNLQ